MLNGQMNVHGSAIFFQIACVFRPGNWDDILALSEHPGKSQLRRRTADLLRDLSHGLGQMQLALEVFALERGMVTPPVVLRNVVLRPEASSKETASQWAVGDKAVAQLAARDRKSTRLNSSHRCISHAVFCLKKNKKRRRLVLTRGRTTRATRYGSRGNNP